MGDKLSKKIILISDKHNSIKAFATEIKIEHHSFNAAKHTAIDGKGVQLLNNIAERIDTLLNRTCRGVYKISSIVRKLDQAKREL